MRFHNLQRFFEDDLYLFHLHHPRNALSKLLRRYPFAFGLVNNWIFFNPIYECGSLFAKLSADKLETMTTGTKGVLAGKAYASGSTCDLAIKTTMRAWSRFANGEGFEVDRRSK